MNIRLFSVLALAGAMLSGCVMEELSYEGGSIPAEMETDQTRTAVTDEGTFTWSSGDQVWLHTTSGYATGMLSSGEGTSTARFSFGSYSGEMTGKAVYPYNAGHDISGDVLSVVMPASYDLGSSLTNTNAVMCGVNVGGTLKFNHMAGVMRFKFKNVPAGVNRFTITLDKKINGTFTADLTADYPVIETSAASSDSEKSITLNFNALAKTSDISLYIPLPIGTYETLELGLYDDEESVWTYSNIVTNTIKRKSLKLMPVVSLGGDIEDAVVDLSENGTANSYIVPTAGSYGFTPTKGNSNESVGTISSVAVLWETFGTDVTPNVGDLVKNVCYADGVICFETPSTFKEGNAVIAAKDADGNILWSWHIWLTDQPQGQEYYNNAGTMMDRNLGATSATPGNVGALGLLYQWGRKDPFLGSSSISSRTLAKSTIAWPSAVSSDSSKGTIAYATANPTTFIWYNSYNYDWYYTGSSTTDNTRWTTSATTKSIYDPCPSGWRVPDGGYNGIWSKALGSLSSFEYPLLYDRTNEGINFSGKFGLASTIWYPASGYRYDDGSLDGVCYCGLYWSASPNSDLAYGLVFDNDGVVDPSNGNLRAFGQSVRCIKEGTGGGSSDSGDSSISTSSAVSLTTTGTSNSYIVSQKGTYSFPTVKGNSSASVGSVESAEVLWESFGTDVTPEEGDLVSAALYRDGNIYFKTADTFKEGNAVIAAKDASGKILWSWHIWLTDQPQEQVYYNNAGTMMDRNLGATSATPGDVGALGLMYQWGRKDPFLGSSSRCSNVTAMSTAIWPVAVYSNSMYGTIDYAVSHPTTFIAYNDKNNDWYYTGSSYTDNTRWTTSEIYKSIYDPCPAGWRVPDGGLEGVWAKACGSSKFRIEFDNYNRTNNGIDFSSIFGADQTIWYPATGMLLVDDDGAYKAGHIYDVADEGNYWSSSPDGEDAYQIYFNLWGDVYPRDSFMRACGCSVRCIKEGSASSVPSEIVNLSATKSANAYVVSEPGTYRFSTVKGNSSESVGTVASAEVLWESFGTHETPQVGDLVREVSYANGEIYFKTANSFTEGNVVIAAKDAYSKILWSWHIWLTDQPQELVCYNNAGTMMDRNLGATSATPGEVGAMGLIYQWGRKDPFLGSSCIWKDEEPKSTISWPSAVSSNSSNGTIEYATANPTTFIKYNGNNYDWYYTGSSSTDNTRWTTSETSKSIYDPCPAGWRVPDGGSNSVWFKAGFNTTTYDSDKIGILFSTASSQTWYPAAGCRDYDGEICNVDDGYYWSASPCGNYAYYLYFYDVGNDAGFVTSSNCLDRALGNSVRCVKEGPLSPAPSEIVNLSATDSANSYIVSEPGTYRFSTVKGNSSESVGTVASAEVLWESFGTHETPQVGDLVREVSYANGDIYFKTASTFREGNAIIAARDASDNILWSWHIWLTDQPQEQVYYSYTDVMNVMMDRNIGATSATPGDVCALGLLYQWGRKDPFLGSSYIDGGDIARSTTAWPSAVSSDPSIGTIEYATSHPTTFIAKNKNNRDWFYTDYMETDNTRWTTSETSKAIYDPCPVGWRVPDGGSDGVWASFGGGYSNTYKGFYFGISFPSSTWYPAAGNYSDSGSLDYVGTHVAYWSASPYYDTAYCLLCLSYNHVYPADDTRRACGLSVRCVRE